MSLKRPTTTAVAAGKTKKTKGTRFAPVPKGATLERHQDNARGGRTALPRLDMSRRIYAIGRSPRSSHSPCGSMW